MRHVNFGVGSPVFRRDGEHENFLIFAADDGIRYDFSRYDTDAHQLRELCLSTPMKYVTLHGLRSYFVTQSRQSGLLDSEIAALIGDKSGAAIIARTYGDFMPEHLLKRANQIRLLAG
jgi:hypothetical protein